MAKDAKEEDGVLGAKETDGEEWDEEEDGDVVVRQHWLSASDVVAPAGLTAEAQVVEALPARYWAEYDPERGAWRVVPEAVPAEAEAKSTEEDETTSSVSPPALRSRYFLAGPYAGPSACGHNTWNMLDSDDVCLQVPAPDTAPSDVDDHAELIRRRRMMHAAEAKDDDDDEPHWRRRAAK